MNKPNFNQELTAELVNKVIDLMESNDIRPNVNSGAALMFLSMQAFRQENLPDAVISGIFEIAMKNNNQPNVKNWD